MFLQGHVLRHELCVVVKCSGRIVYGDELARIGGKVLEADPGFRRVIVDLSEVHELRTGELGTLWLRYMEARARGWRIAFVRLPSALLKMLTLHSIEDAFEIFADEEEALKSLQKTSKRGAAA